MELSINERKEVEIFVKEMSELANIISKIRSENECLKIQLAKETADKEKALNEKHEEITKRKLTEQRVQELEDEKHQETADKKKAINEKHQEMTKQKVIEKRVRELEDENHQQTLRVEEMEMNAETTKKRSEDETVLDADKTYVKQLADAEDKVEHLKYENLIVNIHNEYLTKYKENYYKRKQYHGCITEELENLEGLTTRFSFFRKQETKRRSFRRIRYILHKATNSSIQ